MSATSTMPSCDEIHVLWISEGAGCGGNAVSTNGASSPGVEDVVGGSVPGLPTVLLHKKMPHHEADGDVADAFRRAARGELGPFVLVVEGSISPERISGERIDRIAPRARAVVAAGTCASHDETRASVCSPAGCRGLADHLGWDFRSASGMPIVNVPGCPVRPGALMENLLWTLYRVAGLASPGSPHSRLSGEAVHEECARAACEEQADFTGEGSTAKSPERGGGRVPAAAAEFERVRAVADAVLYEGYLLYPYRKSSAKNRVRWQFGILAPRSWVEADGPVAPALAGSIESWRQQTECLFEAPYGDRGVMVHLRVRFLQLQAKSVKRQTADGRYEQVESLDLGGDTHLTFDEAVSQESDVVVALADLLDGDQAFAVEVPGGEEVEQLGDGSARVVRRRWPVSAMTTMRAERLDAPVAAYRLRVTTENTGPAIEPGTPRNEALRHSLIAAHTFLGGRGLEFESLIEPTEWASPHVRACRNIHTFPVLAGDSGARDLVLSSPILLYDHPRIAPESPGDLHDAAEIDEILSLRTLTLTDEEKREARATDPRAAEILDRVEGMPQEVMARLHGAVRSLRSDPTGEGEA